MDELLGATNAARLPAVDDDDDDGGGGGDDGDNDVSCCCMQFFYTAVYLRLYLFFALFQFTIQETEFVCVRVVGSVCLCVTVFEKGRECESVRV